MMKQTYCTTIGFCSWSGKRRTDVLGTNNPAPRHPRHARIQNDIFCICLNSRPNNGQRLKWGRTTHSKLRSLRRCPIDSCGRKAHTVEFHAVMHLYRALSSHSQFSMRTLPAWAPCQRAYDTYNFTDRHFHPQLASVRTNSHSCRRSMRALFGTCPTADMFLSVPYVKVYFCASPTARPVVFPGLQLLLGLLFSTLGISGGIF
ncbi:hypothetical protein DFH94DRAFT_767720 [Russula ochroleuca]|uniref:Uncharacterized protein n=1 Tax=Russula ochroleuca TaxID=152965 RepID=A0A9P5K037_9AGAM|nr:hypothetical protein DFH94DRAFT_767720 [Russula ochroleuca]